MRFALRLLASVCSAIMKLVLLDIIFALEVLAIAIDAVLKLNESCSRRQDKEIIEGGLFKALWKMHEYGSSAGAVVLDISGKKRDDNITIASFGILAFLRRTCLRVLASCLLVVFAIGLLLPYVLVRTVVVILTTAADFAGEKDDKMKTDHIAEGLEEICDEFEWLLIACDCAFAEIWGYGNLEARPVRLGIVA